VPVVAAALTGCDWSAEDDDGGWSDRYNWVNFSGVYRGISGGVLVTDYTATPGTPGVTNTVPSEEIDTAADGQLTYDGVLDHSPVVPGTLTINVGTLGLHDDDGDLVGDGTGWINYSTGGWHVDYEGVQPAVGEHLIASYQYTVAGSGGGGAPGPGNTGKMIFSFTIQQEGNVFTITDNNGATYDGRFGSIRSTGGVDQDDTGQTLYAGEEIIAQFEANGVSAAGLNVTIEGTIQGVVEQTGTRYYLSARQIFGTWIEDGGRTGDVNGEASPVGVTPTTDTTTTTD
jgi:hypothetical protein